MEIRVLEYFLMAAREENITKAAALLHITQPTLSRQLMQLEDELGVKLFIRKNHSIVLTPQGQLLKRRAQELVSLAEKTKREVARREKLSGEIPIGSGEYRSSRLFSGILTDFQRDHPDVRYELYDGNSDHIKERIEQGILDIGFLLEPVEIEKYEFIRFPLKEEWGVLIDEKSELGQKEFATPEDLASCPLIMTRRNILRKEIVNWFGEYGDRMNIVASGNLSFNLACLARQNGGAFLNLKKDCSYEGLRFIPLRPRLESSTILVWKRNQTMSPLMGAFVEYLKRRIGQWQDEGWFPSGN